MPANPLLRTVGLMTSLLWITSLAAFGNPIVSPPSAQKRWEKCIVAVGPETAIVSCTVGYQKLSTIVKKLYFTVPAYIPPTANPDFDAIQKNFGMRIECEGRTYLPRYTGPYSTSVLPPPPDEEKKVGDKTEIQFSFEIDEPKGQDFTIVVSYTQPLVSHIAYYLPLYEYHETPGDIKDYTITFIPAGDGEVSLLTKHQMAEKAMRTRLCIHPVDKELIAVKYIPKTGK